MSTLSEIEKRHAARCLLFKDARRLKPPVITDSESVSEHNKLIKKLQTDLLDECFLVDHDVQVILHALRLIAEEHKIVNIENYVGRAWEKVPMNDDDQAVFFDRQVKEAEAREKDAQKKGKIPDVPGQQKMFDPGKMPSAESASPVTLVKMEPVE